MNHDELRDLLPLKALDRLDPDEERALSEHLASLCPECEAELASFRDALGAYAMAAAQDDSLRARRIWRMVESRLDADRIGGGMPPERGRRSAARVRILMGAAAAALIVSLGFSLISLRRGVESARNTASFEVAALRARIDSLERGLEDTAQRVSELKTRLSLTSTLTMAAFSPDTRIVRLAGLTPAPRASATLAFSPGNRTAFMQVAGLPPAPANKVYEAWWIGRRSGPIRAGLFEASPEGISKVALTMPPEGEEIVASAVTLEPAGGTDKPTGSMYLKGTM